MTIDYNKLLTAEQRKEILVARIQQFATEAYQLSLNLKVLQDSDKVDNINKSLDDLHKAILLHQEELEKVSG